MEIQQCLHGYLHGHQLLASTIELPVEVKRTVLLQSDLSGPSVEQGFEEYLTGYPINELGYYAFAKTWYAAEMKRLGCVWTQTLLIEFSDLAKIPHLNYLSKFFKRPIEGNYVEYSEIISFPDSELFEKNASRVNNIISKDLISTYLYENPLSTIIVPSKDSIIHEDAILSIWSDQWPRLRRNFSFCTGALSLRSIGSNELDLQVVSEKSVSSIIRQSEGLIIVDFDSKTNSDWVNIPKKHPENFVREFLWTSGSEIAGERANYIPLLRILNLTGGEDFELITAHKIFKQFFPAKNEAKLLKRNVYGLNNRLSNGRYNKEIMAFLIFEKELEYLDFDDLNISERLIDLFERKEIDFHKLLYLWMNSASENRINRKMWSKIKLEDDEILILLMEDNSLIDEFISSVEALGKEIKIWKSDYSIQEKLIGYIFTNRNESDIKEYVFSILDSESKIITQLYKEIGASVIKYTLDWLNDSKNTRKLLKEWRKEIFGGYLDYVFDWVNRNEVSPKIIDLLLMEVKPERLPQLKISSDNWIEAYREIKKKEYETDNVYLACVVLSIGLSNKVKNCEGIVSEVFADTFNYAASTKIDNYSWKVIRKEEFLEDERHDLPFSFFSFFSSDNDHTKYHVAYWDYCEFLIRTVCNGFIKNRWAKKYFILTFRDYKQFMRAIQYCALYKKGRKFLSEFREEKSKTEITQPQLDYIKQNLMD